MPGWWASSWSSSWRACRWRWTTGRSIGIAIRSSIERTLTVVITQSGETADTLAALREARRKGASSLAVCNVVGSMVTRESDGVIYTHAGPEIGVASTKAFTTQLVALYLLALHLARVKGTLGPQERQPHLDALAHLPHAGRAGAQGRRADSGGRRHAFTRAATSSSWAAAFTTRSRSKAR